MVYREVEQSSFQEVPEMLEHRWGICINFNENCREIMVKNICVVIINISEVGQRDGPS